MANYIPPDKVVSPRKSWSLITVLIDQGEAKPDEGRYSLAIGRWDSEVRLAMRWNGSKESPIGNPQSRGLPTWFIVPPDYEEDILNGNSIPKEKRSLAKNFFPHLKLK